MTETGGAVVVVVVDVVVLVDVDVVVLVVVDVVVLVVDVDVDEVVVGDVVVLVVAGVPGSGTQEAISSSVAPPTAARLIRRRPNRSFPIYVPSPKRPDRTRRVYNAADSVALLFRSVPTDRASNVPIPLNELLVSVRSCTVCAEHLPHGPRPIVQAGSTARIAIIGQAPGRRVHESGIAWNDPSGKRLRHWLGISSDQFYDPDTVALVPMGFCFPGSGKGGDNPPRPECAPLWHDRVLAQLPADRLDIVIGMYAQSRYIEERAATVRETVARWADYLPNRVVLPHPSPRNNRWLAQNPWFESETLPAVRERVAQIIDG